ncbi:hypothetical protein L6164_027512 [Bauhinia variegata]|uniref:Uncharacterized protein n=1 Tax=Bauhinia variegata TaxID=167791 RepID=A0ACB9LUL8_BAUVA|nr:hypothetical protein L6164_027512 [Bauhinia variegata]
MGKRLSVMLMVFLGMVGCSLNMNTKPLVPAVYIFGDSTFDVGTNHFLSNCTAQADHEPYGMDFPNSQPTGRFSNGYNTADEIAKLLGFEMSPPPFLMLVQNDTEYFRSQILKGVNFASGGAGILDETGQERFHGVVSMADQIQQFATVRSNISEHLKSSADADAMINESLFLFSVGSNDFFDLYYYNNNAVTEKMRQDLLKNVIARYENHLENLKNYGARKFGILSIAPLGCVPVMRLPNDCNQELNAITYKFYVLLKGVLKNLTSRFPEMKYSLTNTHNTTVEMILAPELFHIENATSPCCGNLTVNCGPDSAVCGNHDKYLFWDQFHPTQHVSVEAATLVFNGTNLYVAPLNLCQLALAK